MTGNVSQQQAQATSGLRAASTQPPDPSRVPAKPVTPLAAEKAPAPPPALGAADGMPTPRPEDAASLEQGKKDAEEKLAGAKVTPKQLQKANDPRFSAVLKAKSAVDAQAGTGPKAYRAGEQKVLTQAAAQAVADEKHGLAGFRGAKGAAGATCGRTS
jgi:hypothetical protein